LTYDLLLKGGTVIDPSQKIHARKDIAFIDGIVAAVENKLQSSEAKQVIRCTGQIVAPGMIDMHVHVFWGVSHYGIDADHYCIANGVTTAVDAGSAGALMFPGFRKYVIENSATRLFAQLHISSQGLTLPSQVGELENIEFADVTKAIEMVERHRDVIVGIKVRLTKQSGKPHCAVGKDIGMRALDLARKAANEVRLPLVVHPQDAWCDTIDEILAHMKTGDILTHCYHGRACGILNTHGKVRESVRDAFERGVHFDVGHGGGSFSWDVAKRALDQNIQPQTISSDIHTYNVNGPVHSLALTINKFLYLGLTIDEVIAKVSKNPAQALNMSGRIGTLRVGAQGDAVIFNLESGDFNLLDSHGISCTIDELLVPKTVIKAGKLYDADRES